MPCYKEPGLTNGSFLGFGPSGYHTVAYSLRGKGNDKKAKRSPVLCLHGILGNRHFFDPLARVLGKATAVWCPDMPGHGDSDSMPQGADYTWQLYQDDLNILMGRMDAPSLDIVGVSMGGLFGMQLASLPGSPVRRLVLVDIGPVAENDRSDVLAEKLKNPPVFADLGEAEKHMRHVYCGFAPMNDPDWAQMTRDSTRKRPDGKWEGAYDPALGEAIQKGFRAPVLWDAFEKIQAEILVIRGGQSTVLSAAQVAEMQRRNPRVKAFVVPEAGHVPSLNEPKQIDAIKEFLDLNHPVRAAFPRKILTKTEADFLGGLFRKDTACKP